MFEQSDRFILYSIDSFRMPDVKTTFHEYPIVGQVEIQDSKIRSKLIAYLYDGMAGFALAAACFNPHHAIRAIKGNKTIDLVICFTCSGVDIYYGKLEGHANVAPEPRRFYDSVLTDAGVPLSTH